MFLTMKNSKAPHKIQNKHWKQCCQKNQTKRIPGVEKAIFQSSGEVQ